MSIAVGTPALILVLGARCVRAGGALVVRAAADTWSAEFDPGPRKRKLSFTHGTLDGALTGLGHILDRRRL